MSGQPSTPYLHVSSRASINYGSRLEALGAQGEGLIIDLVVDPSLPSADVASRVPVGAPVTDAAGNANGLLLFVEHGRLSALEYWWTADEMPEAFPDPHLIGQPETRS